MRFFLFERLILKKEYSRLHRAVLRGFPKDCAEDVESVFEILTLKKSCPCADVYYLDQPTEWLLLSGEKICMPYRLCLEDSDLDAPSLTSRQQVILDCIFTRSCNGYQRQRSLERLLAGELPEFALPYVVKLCDEYVVEILQVVYERLSPADRLRCRALCVRNIDYIKRAHSRMISYWAEFYRGDCYRYKDYIGRKLYAECFGYRKTGQRVIETVAERSVCDENSSNS